MLRVEAGDLSARVKAVASSSFSELTRSATGQPLVLLIETVVRSESLSAKPKSLPPSLWFHGSAMVVP